MTERDELPPRVTDSPEEIWLNYGDIERDCTHAECCSSGEVTWCEDSVFESDVRYVLATTRDAEVERLKYENFTLAAGQCANVTADDGGTPRCSEMLRLKAEVERLTELAGSEGTRAVEYLRRARKAEAEVERLRADADSLIEECRSAFAEELAAWGSAPPPQDAKQAHDRCVAWLAARAPKEQP